MYFQVIGHWGFFLTGFVERLFSHLIKFVWHALVMQVFTEAKLTNHHLLPVTVHQEEQSTAWQRGGNTSPDRYVTCSECRKSPIWTESPQCALGTHLFTCFPQATAHLFLWKPCRSQACWLQKWSVRFIFIHCCLSNSYDCLPFLCLGDRGRGDLYSKCLPRQYIPPAQSCALKFLCERLLLLLLSVKTILKWPQDPFFPIT